MIFLIRLIYLRYMMILNPPSQVRYLYPFTAITIVAKLGFPLISIYRIREFLGNPSESHEI